MARPIPLFTVLLLAACSEYNFEDKDDPVETPDGATVDALPAIEVDPPEIDFGTIPTGESSAWAVAVTNVGEAPLEVWEVALEAPSGVFTFTALDRDEFLPGEFATLGVTFTPVSGDEELGTLTLRSNDPARPEVEVPLRGGGTAPALVIEPMLHDFGTLEVGERSQVDVELRNEGDADLHIAEVQHATSSPGELFVTDWGALIDGTAVLEPGARATVTVTYAPEDELGPDEATLRVLSDDPLRDDLGAVQLGNGVISSVDHEVSITVTADDVVELYVDGVPQKLPNGDGWSYSDTVTLTLPSGPHLIAAYGDDVANVVSGFIGVVTVDGVTETVTGDGTWLAVDSTPGAAWADPKFDDSAWLPALPCDAADAAIWGTYWPADFYAAGAQWIWGHDCGALGTTWFRRELILP